jgi:hypothetical protein
MKLSDTYTNSSTTHTITTNSIPYPSSTTSSCPTPTPPLFSTNSSSYRRTNSTLQTNNSATISADTNSSLAPTLTRNFTPKSIPKSSPHFNTTSATPAPEYFNLTGSVKSTSLLCFGSVYQRFVSFRVAIFTQILYPFLFYQE